MHDLDDKKPYVICLFLHYILLEMLQSTVLCCILQQIWIWNLFLRKTIDLLTVQCVKENTATKKTQEKVSKIHNNKCHRKPHYSSINLSQKYNTNVQFVCEWHWLRTFVFLQFTIALYDGMTKRWNHDLPLVFKLQTRFPSLPFHFNEENDYHTNSTVVRRKF